MKKGIVLLTAMAVMMSIVVLPVHTSLAYSEDPLAQKNYEAFGAGISETETEETSAVLETTEPVIVEELQSSGTVPTETLPAETMPQVIMAAETLPSETVPAETVPEETAVPETTAPAEEPDAPRGHNGIPLYFQTDYPDEVYGEGTVASNGCSAACLAMVATYLTGHEYLPDEIARYFGDSAENNIARLENGSEVMKLPFRKAENWHDTINALRNGKFAVALMDSRSLFTDSQHFIVLTGLNNEGRIMVNDSYEPNYDKWDIRKGLRNGFDEGDILLGYEGAWIYDKGLMPDEPFIYSEPEPVRGEPRYGIELTEAEKWFIAKVVWVEARGESREGQQAVAEVILNRLVSDKFPDTLQGVVYAYDQFRSAKFLDTAKPYQMQYEAVENALLGPYVLPDDVFYFATAAKTSKVWGQIGGHVFCYADD